MRIGIISETSAGDKNGDIFRVLSDRGFEIENLGMRERGGEPSLSYLHTGFLAAIALNTGMVDFVVGGCGTGQGFLNAALQYPGVFCGLIRNPLDAFLFARINGGNCVSLALNEGYGWGGDVNMSLLFDALFTDERGSGYPTERQEPQRRSRETLTAISAASHVDLPTAIERLPREIVVESFSFPGISERLDRLGSSASAVVEAMRRRMSRE